MVLRKNGMSQWTESFLAERCLALQSSVIAIRFRLPSQLQMESHGFTAEQLRVSTVSMVKFDKKVSKANKSRTLLR